MQHTDLALVELLARVRKQDATGRLRVRIILEVPESHVSGTLVV